MYFVNIFRSQFVFLKKHSISRVLCINNQSKLYIYMISIGIAPFIVKCTVGIDIGVRLNYSISSFISLLDRNKYTGITYLF